MEKPRRQWSPNDPNPWWFNLLFFGINFVLYLLPLWVGLMIYEKYGAQPFAVMALVVYLLLFLGRMVDVMKAIVRNETL